MSRFTVLVLFEMILVTAAFAAMPAQAASEPGAVAPAEEGATVYSDASGARYHLMTEGEMMDLRQEGGVWQEDVDYNVIVDGHGTGLSPPTVEEWQGMVGNARIYEDVRSTKLYTAPYAAPSLPTTYDISTQLYFPKVGNQGSQGSCAAWAATYYSYGYLEAKDNGWTDAKAGTNLSHLMSPAWTFNRANAGGEEGSWMSDNIQIVIDWGVPSLATMPYDDSDALGWGSPDAFREAPLHKATSYETDYFVTGDAAINKIKTWLSSDMPVSFALDADQYTGNLADNVLTAFEYEVPPVSPYYNHANTFVGYDDTKVTNGEAGAFKVVNSWGTGFGSGGYYWLTYDAVKEIALKAYLWLTVVTDHPDYIPTLLATWHFNDAPSRTGSIELGIGSHSSPMVTRSVYFDEDPDMDMPSFMCLDISEFSPFHDSGTTSFYLELTGGSGNLGSFRVESYDAVYVPGAASTASPQSGSVPKSLPGYATLDFPNYVGISASMALDEPTATITTRGQATWVGVDHHYYHGAFSMQSGDVADSETSTLEAAVSDASGVTYYCKVSSQSGKDYLRFYVDGILRDSVSGEMDWTLKTFAFAAGDHTLRWDYVRDASLCGGDDIAWVDKVVIIPEDDALEDNDASGTATTLAPTGTYSGLVGLDDDWYRVWVKEEDTLTARIDLNSSEGDLDLYLYAPDAVTLLDSSITTGSLEIASFTASSTGHHFLLVVPDAGQFSRYSLTLVYEIAVPDLGKNSSLAIVSGTGSFAYMTPSKSMRAVVGSALTGTLTLRSNVTWSDADAVPLIGTSSWGSPTASFFQVSADLPSGISDRIASISVTAPSVPGTYYLVFAFRNESSASHIASATDDAVGSPAWGDGNDVSAFSPTQINASRDHGRAVGNWLTITGMRSVNIPSDALVLEVIPPDATPPITSSSLNGTKGSLGWFRSSVNVTLSASDGEGIGLGTTWKRVDGVAWGEYASTFIVSGSGSHHVEFYSIDRLGNTETVQSVSVDIDLVAPTSSASSNGTVGGSGWYVSDVELDLSASDDLSGAMGSYYSFDGSTWTFYQPGALITIEGSHDIRYYSVDHAGNVEAPRIIQLRIDRSAPISSVGLDGLEGNDGWYLGGVQVTIVANDPLSGVTSQRYRLDGGAWQPYSSSFLVAGQGEHRVEFTSSDAAGNNEGVQLITFSIDSTAPTSSAAVNGTLGFDGWYLSAVQVSIASNDSLSGLLSLQYSLDGGPWANYTSAFEVADSGDHILRFRATDLAGNQEEVKEVHLKVDDALPETDLTENGTLGDSGWFVSEVVISPQGTDLGSGIASYLYRIDGGSWISVKGDFDIDQDGEHTVEVCAVDLAGNIGSIDSLQVMIDASAPSTALVASGLQGNGGWFMSLVDAELQASDAASGVKNTYYSIGGATWRIYSTALALDEEGLHQVRFYSEDLAGNLEPLRTVEVKVDLSAPISTLTMAGDPGSGGWYVSQAVAGIDADDALSGVAHSYYRLDGSYWQEAQGAFSLPDGEHQLDFYSLDVAGNVEAFRSQSVRMDTTAPETLNATSGDLGTGGWFVSAATVSLLASDQHSGIDLTRYRIDGGAWSQYMAPFAISQEGIHLISYYSVDLAGNVAQEQGLTVMVDLEAPLTSLSLEGPRGWGDWYVGQVNITLGALESISGLKAIEWRLDGSTWADYAGKIQIDLTGSHMMEYRSIDQAGNRDSLHVTFFKMDLVAPQLSLDFLSRPYNTGRVAMTFDPIDLDSSVYTLEVRVDGGASRILTEEPFTVFLGDLEDGWHELEVVVTDEAGNSLVKSASFKVDTSPFSPEGPYGPWLLVMLAAIAGATVLLVLPRQEIMTAIRTRPPSRKKK